MEFVSLCFDSANVRIIKTKPSSVSLSNLANMSPMRGLDLQIFKVKVEIQDLH